jgi:hypothetical protein
MADTSSGAGAANDAGVSTESVATQSHKEVKAQLEANVKNARAKIALMQSHVKAAEQGLADAEAELKAHG